MRALAGGDVIDCLLTDVALPDMDSLELLRVAKERRPDLKAVVIAASPTEELYRAALDLGAASGLDRLPLPGIAGDLLRAGPPQALAGHNPLRASLGYTEVTMVKTLISRSDLEHNAGEIVDRARHGELVVVESSGEEQIVLLDATDFRLLRALAASASDSAEMDIDALVVRDYLDERISLGKAGEKLGLSRFELQERFNRLGAPLRLGPSTIEEAQAEIAVLRRSR